MCLLARFLYFYTLRSAQTIARASIETLPHQRVAAAYIHWLIAANGIASQRVDWDTAAAPAAGFGKPYGHYPCPWPPATQRCRPWRHKVAKGWPIRSSTSEMVSAVTWDNPTCTLLYRRFPIDEVRRMRTARSPRLAKPAAAAAAVCELPLGHLARPHAAAKPCLAYRCKANPWLAPPTLPQALRRRRGGRLKYNPCGTPMPGTRLRTPPSCIPAWSN